MLFKRLNGAKTDIWLHLKGKYLCNQWWNPFIVVVVDEIQREREIYSISKIPLGSGCGLSEIMNKEDIDDVVEFI